MQFLRSTFCYCISLAIAVALLVGCGGNADDEISVTLPAPTVVLTGESDLPDTSAATYVVPEVEAPATVTEIIDEGVAVMANLVATYPNHADALEVAARLQLHLGHNDEAAKLWRTCLEHDSTYAYAHLGLGRVAVKNSEYGVAVEHLSRAAQLAPDLADAFHEWSDALAKSGQVLESIRVLRQYADRFPQSATTWVHLGHAHLAAGEHEAAAVVFKRALAQHPEVARAHLGLGTALVRLGRREEAQACFARHQRLRDQTNREFAVALEEANDLHEAARDMAIRFTEAAQVLTHFHNATQAEKLLRRAAQLDRENRDARRTLLSIYQADKRFDNARDVASELVELVPDDTELRMSLAMLQAQTGMVKEAAASLREVIRRTPDSADGYGALAMFLLGTNGDRDEALAAAKEAVARRPQADEYYVLYRSLLANDRSDEAAEAIRRAVQLAPDNTEYNEALRAISAKQ